MGMVQTSKIDSSPHIYHNISNVWVDLLQGQP